MCFSKCLAFQMAGTLLSFMGFVKWLTGPLEEAGGLNHKQQVIDDVSDRLIQT